MLAKNFTLLFGLFTAGTSMATIAHAFGALSLTEGDHYLMSMGSKHIQERTSSAGAFGILPASTMDSNRLDASLLPVTDNRSDTYQHLTRPPSRWPLDYLAQQATPRADTPGGRRSSQRSPPFHRNPSVAVALSLLLPGLGQVYNREYVSAATYLGLDLVAILVAGLGATVADGNVGSAMFGAHFLVATFSAADAYVTARYINTQILTETDVRRGSGIIRVVVRF